MDTRVLGLISGMWEGGGTQHTTYNTNTVCMSTCKCYMQLDIGYFMNIVT